MKRALPFVLFVLAAVCCTAAAPEPKRLAVCIRDGDRIIAVQTDFPWRRFRGRDDHEYRAAVRNAITSVAYSDMRSDWLSASIGIALEPIYGSDPRHNKRQQLVWDDPGGGRSKLICLPGGPVRDRTGKLAGCLAGSDAGCLICYAP
jgi:hypothetical protein